MSDPPLIKTPPLINNLHLCQTAPNYSDPLPRRRRPTYLPHRCGFQNHRCGFQNRGVACDYQVGEDETKRQMFGLIYRCGRFARLYVVCSRLLVI